MYQTNPTQMFRERQLVLLREAQERHLVRSTRAAAPKQSPQSDRRLATFRRGITLWGRESLPFFKA